MNVFLSNQYLLHQNQSPLIFAARLPCAAMPPKKGAKKGKKGKNDVTPEEADAKEAAKLVKAQKEAEEKIEKVDCSVTPQLLVPQKAHCVLNVSWVSR